MQALSAVIASTDGFKQDLELLKKMKHLSDYQDIDKKWFNYLFNNAPLCQNEKVQN